MGEEVRLRGGVRDSGRAGTLLRVDATRGLDGVTKRMKESGVFRDAAKILPQTVLLSPRGVFGLSHPDRNESSAIMHRCVPWKQQHSYEFMGAIPLAMSLSGRGAGPGAYVR